MINIMNVTGPFVFLMVAMRESQHRTDHPRVVFQRSQTMIVNIVSVLYILAALELLTLYNHEDRLLLWKNVGTGVFWSTWFFALVQILLTSDLDGAGGLRIGLLTVMAVLQLIDILYSSMNFGRVILFHFLAAVLLIEFVANSTTTMFVRYSEWLRPDFHAPKNS